jgi:hypothetical protein
MEDVSVDVTTLVGGAVGGAAAQSVLGPIFGQVHYRRELRAKVLDGLATVERERWAASDDRSAFRGAIVQLRGAGLVAGLDRELLDMYVMAAAACYGKSLRRWEESGGDPEGGTISMALSYYVRDCAEAVRSYVWHPRLGAMVRPFTRRQLQVKKVETTEAAEASNEPIRWDSVWLPG